jgi:hypothetical protein
MNPTAKTRTMVLTALGLTAAIIVGFWLLIPVLPYGPRHMRESTAASVAADVMAWKAQGSKAEDLALLAFTNSTTTQLIYRTNFSLHGKTYNILLKHHSLVFRGEGSLLVSQNGSVLWQATNGCLELLLSGKSE